MKEYNIRLAKQEEQRIIEELIRESFWNVYRPGCDEHYLIHELRKAESFVHELEYIIEIEGNVIGHVAFVRSFIQTKTKAIPILTMGPFCIHPDYQKQGYGKVFLDYALNQAKVLGFGAVCIEGNYHFYKHCGFKYGSNYHLNYFGCSKEDDQSFFLCNELISGYLDEVEGEYACPDVYMISKQEAEEFDKQFTPKEKLKLPGQIFG